jgi:hypothetical protein
VVLGAAVVVLAFLALWLARRARRARKARASAGAGSPARTPAGPQPRNPALPPRSAWAREEIPAPTANVAVVTLYELWLRRVEQQKLGTRPAIWADLRETPQFADWQQLAEGRGVDIGQNGSREAGVQHYMTSGLLSEVLYAAGGVERELQILRRALYSQPPQPAGAPATGASRPAASQDGPAGALIAGRPVRDASYSFVNLVSWARATVDNTDRPYRPGLSGRAGLLAALRPGGLHDRVEAALRHLRTALSDSRSLSAYAFHAGAVPGAGKPGPRILPDAGNLAPPAYPLTEGALAGETLRFTEERDMLAYATGLMTAIEVFVDEVLDAFAAAQMVPKPRAAITAKAPATPKAPVTPKADTRQAS